MVASETTDPSKGGEEKQPKRVSSGLLVIPDGYTLTADLKTETGPVLKVWYRPALPDAVFDYQSAVADAKTGKDRIGLMSDFLDAHMVKWSGLTMINPKGEVAELPWSKTIIKSNDGLRRALGTQYLSLLINQVGGYEAAWWEQDEKNS
jgi:hypothetical protein